MYTSNKINYLEVTYLNKSEDTYTISDDNNLKIELDLQDNRIYYIYFSNINDVYNKLDVFKDLFPKQHGHFKEIGTLIRDLWASDSVILTNVNTASEKI